MVEVTGTVVRERRPRPGGVELDRRRGRGALRPRRSRRRSTCTGPTLTATLPTLLDHAARGAAAPGARRRFGVARPPSRGFRATLDEPGFIEIHTPKIVGVGDRVRAPTSSRIDYFGRPAYLAQSPQFYKQTMVGVFERVYEVGPVFRAEPHDTARHLAAVHVARRRAGLHRRPPRRDGGAARRLAGMVAEASRRPAPWRLGSTLPEVPDEIPVVHFAEALRDRRGADPPTSPTWRPAARAVRWASGRCASTARDFLFVTGYPMVQAAVLHASRPGATRLLATASTCCSAGIELVTGGQRLHRYADYLAALAARGRVAGAVRGLPGGVPARHAAARRLRDRPGAVHGAADRGGQRPRGDAVPARPAPR